jgi:predicted phosphodiesterase
MILILGDTHGYFREFTRRMDSLKITDATILHVGDFGIGFKDTESKEVHILQELNGFLKKSNNMMYVIRGNHDNPSYFNGSYNYSHLKLLPDYSVLELEGEKILMVGGAISIDRRQRLNDMQLAAGYGLYKESYWYDEGFVLDEDKVKDLEGITCVVTHSVPGEAKPVNNYNNHYDSHGSFVESFAKNDNKLKDDLNKERIDLSNMYSILKEKNTIKKWYYGHFHSTNKEIIDGTEFIMVDVSDLIEHR